MLMMSFTLPISNTVGPEYFPHLVANFHFGSVTDELSGGSPFPDLVLKCVDKLSVCLHGVYICNQRLYIHKDLGNGGSRLMAGDRCNRVNGQCNKLILNMHIEGRKRRFVLLLQESAHGELPMHTGW